MHTKYFIAHEYVNGGEWIGKIHKFNTVVFGSFFSCSIEVLDNDSELNGGNKKYYRAAHQMIINIHNTYVYMIERQYRPIYDGKEKRDFIFHGAAVSDGSDCIACHLNKLLIPHPAFKCHKCKVLVFDRISNSIWYFKEINFAEN